MLCPTCEDPARRFGRNRNGSQRWRCDDCALTFTDERTRPLDRRLLARDKAILALRMLLEGNSVRSVERLTDIHRDTIIGTMVMHGEKCKRFLEATIRRVTVNHVQGDEMWGYVGCKQKTADRRGYGEEFGDAYCFVGIERRTKLVLAWHLGKRDDQGTVEFAVKLRRAVNMPARFQLSTDGFPQYQAMIPHTFGPYVDWATLVKVYGEDPDEDKRRYSPARVIDVRATAKHGNPDMDAVCTSHVERNNLTMRMQIRRLTRLTNAFSKKWENHEAALGLFFAYYNFCRVHMTLKTTPAVASELADHPWSVAELLDQAGRVR